MTFRLLTAFLLSLTVSARAAERHVVLISLDGFPAAYLNDAKVSLPVLRGLARAGVSATEGMSVSNPSVTWPNHTTLMTGVHPERHGVLFNGLPERQKAGRPARVTPERTQKELVRVPLLFDHLKAAGLTSAAINWPCTAGSESLADNFPDVPDALKYTTPRLKDELAEQGLLAKFETGDGPARDEVWTEAARQVIRQRKPRLLVLHLLNLDSTHHRNGPGTEPGHKAATQLDALVGRVLTALDEAGIRNRTTVFVVADHGFAAIKKSLYPNALLRREGLLNVDSGKIVSARAHVIPEGGIGMVYLTNPATAAKDRETVKRLFQDAEGIAAVLEPADFAKYHLPRPDTHPAMADLILAAKDGYAVTGSAAGDELVTSNPKTTGAHGFLSTEPKMRALFLASGAAIKSGVELGTVDNSDVAPTIARILGVPLPDATGRVLAEILEE